MAHEISLFEPAFNKEPTGKMTVEEFIHAVKFGKWRDVVDPVRNETDDFKRKELKKRVPGVTVSGTFYPTRLQSNLQEHSGFICIDIDDFTEREKLLGDPYTFALFSSISNTGVAVIVKINPEKHKESFHWLLMYYYNTYGIFVDRAPSNPASLRFVSYDPACIINEKAKKSKCPDIKEEKPASLPVILPEDKIAGIVKEIADRKINIAEQYADYLRLGFALADMFGERGRAFFHSISSASSKYKSTHCDKQYDACLKHHDNRTTIGFFFWLAKENGIEIPRDEKYERAVRSVAIAKKSGRTMEGAEASLVEIDGMPHEEAHRIATEVYARQDITLTTIAADPERLIESLISWMHLNYPMKKNLITCKLENAEGEVTKEMMNTIFLQARSAFNTPNVSFDLVERIVFSNYTEEFHPIKDYIERNRYRNTTGNIDRLIGSIRTNTPNAAMFIRKWLLSLIAAVDGVPVRLVLALCGKQMTGKTEFFRRLMPEGLKKYYGESKMDAGKDDELLMTQKLIIMDDEMSGKSKADEKRFKDLTSKHTFSLRAPYDRANMDYRRLAVLCGTSNDKEIINDPTGNTRILPVEVESIDFEGYNNVDKDELFMEIVRAHEAGEDWNLSKDARAELDNVSSEFEAINYERELLMKFFAPADDENAVGEAAEMSATEIKDYIENRSKQQIRSLKKMGIELRSYFGERITARRGGQTIKIYPLKILNNSEGATAESGSWIKDNNLVAINGVSRYEGNDKYEPPF